MPFAKRDYEVERRRLQRVMRLRRKAIFPTWVPEDFESAFSEGKNRWQETEELFGMSYPIWRDAVSEIAPSFQLAMREEAAVQSMILSDICNGYDRIALYFLKWERCRETSGLPNPYEPWIEIWEHGGWFSVEHGQFVDVYGRDGRVAGGFVQRA